MLPPGRPTGRNQAQYGEPHRRRLLFIRALTGIGQLELSTVLELLAVIEDNELSYRGSTGLPAGWSTRTWTAPRPSTT
ncbi:hypothetical protein NKG94_27220 [Micromonospora sp. M12]